MNRRVLIYGDTTWDRLGASYCRAFEALGCNVMMFDTRNVQEELSPWLRNRFARRLSRNSLALRRLGSRHWNQQLIERCRSVRPHLTLLISGQMVMPETVEALQSASDCVAVFFPDNPLPEASQSYPEELSVARRTDWTFIWSRKLADYLECFEAGPTQYLPFAWDPEVFPFVSGRGDSTGQVVFIGGWDPFRERWLEPVSRQFDLKIWGPDYWGRRTERGSEVRRAWQGHALYGEAAAEVISGAPIAINILREQNLPDGTNMRTFEVPGCGGFSLATRTQGALEIFPENEAAAYFSTRDELLTTIERYLKDERARHRMRKRAHKIVASRHRYVNRAEAILAVA